MISHIFNLILVQPILNLLVYFYNYIHDIGIVIILVTIIIRILLLPSFHKSLKSQSSMQALQPKMNEIREKYKDNKEEQARQLMALYKEHNFNPLSSCFPLLIQLPILIALYRVFIIGLGGKDLSQYLYSFIHNPGVINPYFLHFVNLSKSNIYFGLAAALAQFWQSWLMVPKEKSNDATQNALTTQTVYILPIITFFLYLRWPAGLPLYWITTTLFAVGQQYYIMKNNRPAEKIA